MTTPTPIPRMHGSPTHALAREVFLRHDDAGTGLCVTCENPVPCAPARHAAEVLRAAGDDPAGFRAGGAGRQPDRAVPGRPGRTTPPGRVPPPARATPPGRGQPPGARVEDDSRGFSVTGRQRPMHPAGYGYERDQ